MRMLKFKGKYVPKLYKPYLGKLNCSDIVNYLKYIQKVFLINNFCTINKCYNTNIL